MARKPVSIRQKRVAERILEILSEALQTAVDDPRLSMVNVVEVRVDRELEFAQVWVNSAVADDTERQSIMRGLRAASGFLRHVLAQQLTIFKVPKLLFNWDDQAEKVTRVLSLLDQIKTTESTEGALADVSSAVDELTDSGG
jgi:ribosome-binding factor A